MVSVKCKACGQITARKRTPSRCGNCGAKFAVVGGELVYSAEPTPKAEQKPAIEHKIAPPSPKFEPSEIAAPPKPKQKKEPKRLEIARQVVQETETKTKEENLECGNCGAKITRRMENCENCGVRLDWENIIE